MKICLDISQIAYQGTGVSRYLNGLVKAILNNQTKHQWSFFFSSLRSSLDPRLEQQIKKRGFKTKKFLFPPSLLSFLWNRLHLLDVQRLIGDNDWYISSDWTEPPAKNMRKATIIHDLAFLRYPKTVTEKIKQTQRQRLNWVKKETDIIFTDSQSTKNDLINLLNIEPEKIKVVYPGVNIKKPTKKIILQTRQKYRLTEPFILTVGKIEPRKNIKRLIHAYSKITNPKPKLIIVGPPGWEDSKNWSTVDSINRSKIEFLGYVNDQELFSLYSLSLFFIYPSIWEGFGYPVVEAMKLGIPVATSNTSSLQEIADGDAFLFNPFDVDSIKQALEKMINDQKLRKNLSIKGKQRAKKFNWSQAYGKIIKTLENG